MHDSCALMSDMLHHKRKREIHRNGFAHKTMYDFHDKGKPSLLWIVAAIFILFFYSKKVIFGYNIGKASFRKI